MLPETIRYVELQDRHGVSHYPVALTLGTILLDLTGRQLGPTASGWRYEIVALNETHVALSLLDNSAAAALLVERLDDISNDNDLIRPTWGKHSPGVTSVAAAQCPDCHAAIASIWLRNHGINLKDLSNRLECSECGEVSFFLPNDYICMTCRGEALPCPICEGEFFRPWPKGKT